MNSRRSERLAGQELQASEGNNQGQAPPPSPENWQQVLADMQARSERQEEEIRLLRQQQVPAGNLQSTVPAVLQPEVPVVVQPQAGGDRWEPLYERFRKQHPPAFRATHIQ